MAVPEREKIYNRGRELYNSSIILFGNSKKVTFEWILDFYLWLVDQSRERDHQGRMYAFLQLKLRKLYVREVKFLWNELTVRGVSFSAEEKMELLEHGVCDQELLPDGDLQLVAVAYSLVDRDLEHLQISASLKDKIGQIRELRVVNFQDYYEYFDRALQYRKRQAAREAAKLKQAQMQQQKQQNI